MDRFAAWSLGEPLNDPEGRYRIIHGGKPTACRPDVQRFVSLSIQDATYPASRWQPRKAWDEFVEAGNLWLRDSAGNRILGWGHGPRDRYVVNLALSAPWASAIMACEQHARATMKADGLHIDDLGIHSHWEKACGHLYDHAAYQATMETIAQSVTKPASVSGWGRWYNPPHTLQPFDVVKMEGLRYAPGFRGGGWDGPDENPFTWGTWLWGRRGKPAMYGLLGLERLGVAPEIEAQYDEVWGAKKIEDYARIAVVTACFGNRCHVAVHANRVWTNPYWSEAHEQALKLGEPVELPKRSSRFGTWHRMFEHGCVVMNPTAERAAGVDAHQAAIVIWK